jgi:hypothetical protein
MPSRWLGCDMSIPSNANTRDVSMFGALAHA